MNPDGPVATASICASLNDGVSGAWFQVFPSVEVQAAAWPVSPETGVVPTATNGDVDGVPVVTALSVAPAAPGRAAAGVHAGRRSLSRPRSRPRRWRGSPGRHDRGSGSSSDAYLMSPQAFGASSSMRRVAVAGTNWTAVVVATDVVSFRSRCTWPSPGSTNESPTEYTCFSHLLPSASYSVTLPAVTMTKLGPGCVCQPVVPPGCQVFGLDVQVRVAVGHHQLGPGRRLRVHEREDVAERALGDGDAGEAGCLRRQHDATECRHGDDRRRRTDEQFQPHGSSFADRRRRPCVDLGPP